MTTWIIDSHLHFYPCYSEKDWFENLFLNLKQHLGHTAPVQYVGFLTERLTENYFDKWKQAQSCGVFSLQYHPGEFESILVTAPDQTTCRLFNAQQIITKEGVEILSLGKKIFNSDRSITISEAIQTIKQNGALPVLPWSFGKWHGKRLGNIIHALEDTQISKDLFFGDICGRDNFTGSNFNTLQTKYSNKILSGSDPLPMRGEEKFAGRKVTLLQNNLPADSSLDFKSVRDALLHTQSFSTLEVGHPTALATLIRQIKLRTCRQA